MNAQRLNVLSGGLAIALLATTLVSCRTTEPVTTAPSPSPTATAVQSETAATLSAIHKQPVWVKTEPEKSEASGEEGMGLKVGDTIRTEGEALAQIELNNGLGFRIGGDSILTLQPDTKLELGAGEMITWVKPGQKVPAEIITPAGIAGIRGTTVYVNIPKNPEEGILYFSWEGKVAVRLPNQTEEILLESGQEVRVPPGETDLAKIKAAVRQLSKEEWQERRQKSRLLDNFDQPIPTLGEIEAVEKGMN